MNVAVPASTNRVSNGAPYGLGANFVDFTGASGSLTVSFDGWTGRRGARTGATTSRGTIPD